MFVIANAWTVATLTKAEEQHEKKDNEDSDGGSTANRQPSLISRDESPGRIPRDDLGHHHHHHQHLSSSVYGAPAGNFDLTPSGSISSGYSVPHQQFSQHGQYPSSSLLRPSDSYSVPSTHHHGTSGSYSVPQQGKPSDNYGLPPKVPGYSPTHHQHLQKPFLDGYGSTVDNAYKAPSPTASYGSPTSTYGPPTQTYGPPSQSYGLPSQSASPVGIKPSYSGSLAVLWKHFLKVCFLKCTT